MDRPRRGDLGELRRRTRVHLRQTAFKDNHTAAFLLAFGAALSITIVIEVVRHIRSKGKPEPGADVVDEFKDEVVDQVKDGVTDSVAE